MEYRNGAQNMLHTTLNIWNHITFIIFYSQLNPEFVSIAESIKMSQQYNVWLISHLEENFT